MHQLAELEGVDVGVLIHLDKPLEVVDLKLVEVCPQREDLFLGLKKVKRKKEKK